VESFLIISDQRTVGLVSLQKLGTVGIWLFQKTLKELASFMKE
jgi:hypothetical protein